jgi:hypothetical protein
MFSHESILNAVVILVYSSEKSLKIVAPVALI